MFEQQDNTRKWARNKHLTRRCSCCGKDKDPFLLDIEYSECPDCQQKRRLKNTLKKEHSHEQEEQSDNKGKKGLFDNIIWPE